MFHRLTAPSYIGGLPAGYDYLNDPVANAFPGAGVPAPVDTGALATPSPNAGTYFVGFGENGRAFAPNRGFYALGTNTDFIDDFLHGNFAVLASVDIAVGNPAVIVGTVANPVFVGPPGTTNDAAGLEQYFHITDQNNNDIVDASNNQCVVTAASAGVGTFYVGTLTLTLNITPPAGYRIWYGTRSSLIEMTRGNLIRSSVWGIARKPASLFQFANDLLSTNLAKGASTVGLNTTGFTASTLTSVNNGGLGTAGISTVRDGFLAVDRAVIRRRAFMAVLTDGTNSVGGDYNGPDVLDQFLSSVSGGGTYFLRPGEYFITDAAGPGTSQGGGNTQFLGDAFGVGLTLAAARSTDFTFSGTVVADNIFLQSESSAHKRFISQPAVGTPFIFRNGVFQTGALSCGGGFGGGFTLEDATYFSPGTGAPVASLDISGEAQVSIRRCRFADASNDGVNDVYIHDFADDTASSVTIEDSYFASFEANIDAVRLFNVTVPMIFRNCVFDVTTQLGSGYPCRLINNNAAVTFENCLFRSLNGHVFWGAGSNVHLKGCRFISTDDFPGVATSQMIMINGDSDGALCTIEGCTALIGASSVKGQSATIQKAIVEIGGTAGFATTDRPINIDGLNITYSAGVSSLHNFVTVLLHGGTSASVPGSSVRTYKNVTVNGSNIFPDNTGTLGGVYRTPGAYPTLVTIGGGDSRASTVVENLHVVNVANPTVDHDRQVLFAYRATLRDLIVDGASITAGGKFTRDTVELWECDAYNVNIERKLSVKTNQSHLLLSKTTRVRGGEFVGRVNVDPFAYILFGDDHCDLSEFAIHFPSVIVTSTSPIIFNAHLCCSLVNCRVFIDGDWGGRIVSFPAGSDMCRVKDNLLFWRRNAGQILLSSGEASQVTGNTMMSTNTAAPTYSVSGTGAVDDNNVFRLYGSAVANPV